MKKREKSIWLNVKVCGYSFSSKLNEDNKVECITIINKDSEVKASYLDGDPVVVPKGVSKIVYYILNKILPVVA